MKAVVVFESMYGNTHAVADRVAAGLRSHFDVVTVPVGQATPEVLSDADLLVVGGPTHVHSMSRMSTRKAAAQAVGKAPGLALEPDATGTGLREWFDLTTPRAPMAAAFDTRLHGPGALTGRAGKGIARRLRRLGCELVAPPVSFFVNKHEALCDGERERAHTWGDAIARLALARRHHSYPSRAA